LQFGQQFAVNLFGRVQSGAPYTAMIATDVNGDGRTNDRAFVFAPAAIADTFAAKAMSTLLNAGQSRSCLAGQVGRIAAPNSCFGPWTASLGTEVVIPPRWFGLSERAHVSLAMPNVLAGVDRLWNSGNVRGWGQELPIESSLLQPVAFDANARKYAYVVNPNFGKASPVRRLDLSPFRVILNFKLDVGPDPDQQRLAEQVRQVAAVPGPPDAERLQQHFARNVPNIALAIVRLKDSLALTSEQVAQVRQIADLHAQIQTRIWAPLAQYFVDLKLDYSASATVDKYRVATTAAYAAAAETGVAVRGVLEEFQVRRLSLAIRRYFDPATVKGMMRDRF
jgi:hypothetical protein